MGTHYNGSTKEIDALDSYIKLIRSAESLNAKINLELSAFDLTESQFGVLDALFHLGPMKHKEIGKKILKSGGNITMVINNLERRELVLYFVRVTKYRMQRTLYKLLTELHEYAVAMREK